MVLIAIVVISIVDISFGDEKIFSFFHNDDRPLFSSRESASLLLCKHSLSSFARAAMRAILRIHKVDEIIMQFWRE